MLYGQFHTVVGCAIVLAVLPSCGSGPNERPANSGSGIECTTKWEGEISVADELSVRACLTSNACSKLLTGPHYFNADHDPNDNPDCNSCGGGVHDQFFLPGAPDATSVVVSWWNVPDSSVTPTALHLLATIGYSPRTSEMLGDATRPSLTVQADTGEMLVDSVAQQPLVGKVVPGDPGGTEPPVTCKVASLNLDGSARSDPL